MEFPDFTDRSTRPVVLMCDAPVTGVEGSQPFPPNVGERLSQLLGIPTDSVPTAFDLMYMFDRPPLGEKPIPLHVARYVGEALMPKLQRRHVLFYGRALPLAFGFTPNRPFRWHGAFVEGTSEALFSFAVVPDFDGHDDPVWSQWWSREGSLSEAGEFLRPLVHPRARGC